MGEHGHGQQTTWALRRVCAQGEAVAFHHLPEEAWCLNTKIMVDHGSEAFKERFLHIPSQKPSGVESSERTLNPSPLSVLTKTAPLGQKTGTFHSLIIFSLLENSEGRVSYFGLCGPEWSGYWGDGPWWLWRQNWRWWGNSGLQKKWVFRTFPLPLLFKIFFFN